MSKKTEKKKQEKIIQDKTFGLKNKNKSKAVQNYCKGVAQAVKFQGQSVNRLEQEEYERKKAQLKQEEEDRLLNQLYSGVKQAQAEQEEEEEELDPRFVLCEYFKQGLCQKGKKCKFSHDMSLEQKTQLLDLYTDQRDQLGDDIDSCHNWDDKTFKDIVEANQNKYISQIPSERVCDYFLDAVEKGKYGWRWVCPNGMSCHYRHCLPQGFVLKKKADDKVKDNTPIEDIIDQQREKIKGGGTKVTKEVFEKWKAERAIRKQQEADKKLLDEQKKKGGAKATNNNLTGRALFKYDPNIFIDDDEAAQDYDRDVEEQQEEDDDGSKQYSDDEEQQFEKQEIQQEQQDQFNDQQ